MAGIRSAGQLRRTREGGHGTREGGRPALRGSGTSSLRGRHRALGRGPRPSRKALSPEVTSIEDDLARIEEALGSDEVLEEFTPSEPLSADNPVVWPTDI